MSSSPSASSATACSFCSTGRAGSTFKCLAMLHTTGAKCRQVCTYSWFIVPVLSLKGFELSSILCIDVIVPKYPMLIFPGGDTVQCTLTFEWSFIPRTPPESFRTFALSHKIWFAPIIGSNLTGKFWRVCCCKNINFGYKA